MPDDSELLDPESDDSAEDLIRCPECNSEIYAEADGCPVCGYDITAFVEYRRMVGPPVSPSTTAYFIFVLLVLLLGIAVTAFVFYLMVWASS